MQHRCGKLTKADNETKIASFWNIDLEKISLMDKLANEEVLAEVHEPRSMLNTRAVKQLISLLALIAWLIF